MGGGTDRWVWLAFLLVLLLSGLIAYVGDLIGRRIGRKRLTIFGLRPKRTAILFTVLTGMTISGVAMTLLLVASEGARQRILNYNRTVSTLQERIDEQTLRRREAQERADAAKLEVEQAEKDLAQRGQELKIASADRQKAEQQLAGAQQQTAAAQAKAAETQRRVVDAQRRLNEAQRRLSQASRVLAASEASLRRADAELNERQKQLAAAEQRLAAAEKQLANAERILATADAQERSATARLHRAEAALQETERQRLDAVIARDAITADLARAQMRSEEVLEGELIARYREELGRSLFRYNTPRPEIEQQLETFMRSIDREARDRGAAPDPEQGGQAAILPGNSAAAAEVYRLNVIDFLATATTRQPIWLRAIATRNAVKGQPLGYQLRAVPDRIVFLQGAELGSAPMDGSDDEATLARQLEALIREQVNPKAREQGLLPNVDGDYSRIGPERWLPVLREIQQRGGPVTVQALAAQEIRTGDPLDVEFRVLADGSP